jgi:hypothetical protein
MWTSNDYCSCINVMLAALVLDTEEKSSLTEHWWQRLTGDLNAEVSPGHVEWCHWRSCYSDACTVPTFSLSITYQLICCRLWIKLTSQGQSGNKYPWNLDPLKNKQPSFIQVVLAAQQILWEIEGQVMVKLYTHKCRTRVKFPRVGGRGPESWFWSSCNRFKLVSWEISGGIGPVNRLPFNKLLSRPLTTVSLGFTGTMAQYNVSVKPIGSLASGNSHSPRQLLLLSLKQWKDICE